MKRFILPLSAFLILVLPMESLAQSVSSSSSSLSGSSLSSVSSASASSLSRSSLSASSLSRSSATSSRISSSRSSSVSSLPKHHLTLTDIDLDRYSDAPWDLRTDLAISALTDIGILRGNDDGTFRPTRTLNRAEFIEIIIRLLDDGTANTNCFPDVRPSDWYASAVCRAKAMGIVRGNARDGVPEAQWRFEPARDVQYEEAVKVLVKLYALPIIGDEEGADWYVPFIEKAQDEDLAIDGLEPGDRITRGEMAQLTAAFVAHSTGQLEEYRDAEEGRSSSSVSSRTSSRSSAGRTSSASSRSSTSSRTGTGSGIFDPLTDTQVQSNILLLGEASPILAGVRFFSNNEPVLVDEITVTFTAGVDSIQSLLIYDQNGELLGTATTNNGGATFSAAIPEDRFSLPMREDRTIYVRARLKEENAGGVSGETVQVDEITLEGSGEWSNSAYTTTSNETFRVSRTAQGMITGITNDGDVTATLASGPSQLLGEFRFTAQTAQNAQDVRVTGLSFNIEQSGGVSLSNVSVNRQGSNEESSCTASSTIVTCSSIPAAVGSIDDPLTLQVYGDVTIPSGASSPRLRLTLNEPGSPTSAGAVSWTDGVTTFNWLPFSQPVVQGTMFQ